MASGPRELAVFIGSRTRASQASQPLALLFIDADDAMTDRRPALTIERAHYPKASGTYRMSEHALRRMYGRSLCLEAVCRALRYGRVTFARGAAHFVLGKNEVARYEPVRLDDDGLQLVVSSLQDGRILTLYRNKETLPRD